MEYYQLKAPHGFCPRCSRPLDLLLPAEDGGASPSFYICFKCKSIHQFDKGRLTRRQNLNFLKSQTRAEEINELVDKIPNKHHYLAKGSQLRLAEQTQLPQRQWLSLTEYERIFKSTPPTGKLDLRADKSTCKWCGTTLSGQRRSFCRDSCSRHYGKATFFKRTMAALPYRIACRDRFFCQVSRDDLALTNKHGQRLPAPGSELDIHHLVHVADGGTDHESNLITLGREIHREYHQGDPGIVSKLHEIKEHRLETMSELMNAK